MTFDDLLSWRSLSYASYRYSIHSLQFMDAYHQGLDGKQAAWATKNIEDIE
jgi:hypothetical protein